MIRSFTHEFFNGFLLVREAKVQSDTGLGSEPTTTFSSRGASRDYAEPYVDTLNPVDRCIRCASEVLDTYCA
jgi:hypothetical protein